MVKYLNNYVIALVTFILVSVQVLADDSSDILVEQEKAFSDYSAQHGFRAAFKVFGASDMVKLDPRSIPINGLDTLLATLSEDSNKVTITWVPSDAHISPSHDMGFTYGIYTVSIKQEDGTTTKNYGKYFTVWAKNSAGIWKVVLDGGNSLPKDYAPDS